MKILPLNVKKLCEDAVLPTYGTEYSAGADLYACLPEPIVIEPNQTKFIKTGLAFEIPEGTVGLVYARSGLSCKRDLAPANKVGVIDSDYRGEVMVALHNHGSVPQSVEPKERIAQFVLMPYIRAAFAEAEELSSTVRGEGGFGSTGKL